MHRFIMRLAILALLQGLPLSAPASSAMQGIVNEYETFFRALVKDHDYPGAAFAIVSRDEILHIATIGHTNASRRQPVDIHTTFRLASVSKTFAAEMVGLPPGTPCL